MEINKPLSPARYSPQHELAWYDSSWLQLSLPETLPLAWRRLIQSYCSCVLLMFEKNSPGNMVLTIHQKDGRLRMDLVTSPKFGMPEELSALRIVAAHYAQLSAHILR